MNEDNKLIKFREDIRNGKFVSYTVDQSVIIEVDQLYLHDILAMNADELQKGGFPELCIDDFLSDKFKRGIPAFNGLHIFGVTIKVV